MGSLARKMVRDKAKKVSFAKSPFHRKTMKDKIKAVKKILKNAKSSGAESGRA